MKKSEKKNEIASKKLPTISQREKINLKIYCMKFKRNL